jgi:CBS domain-containing protein
VDTVKDMLDAKGRDIWCISPSKSVYQAVELMAEKEIGALPVLDDSGALSGIVSERDYARKVILKNKVASEVTIEEIMTRAVISIDENSTIETCMFLMSDNEIRHLPVVVEGRLAGIITVGDLLKFNLKQKLTEIRNLEDYILHETGGSG